MNIFDVVLSKNVVKDLRQFPKHIILKLQAWVKAVGEYGLREVQKIPGFHDEPSRGKRQGQRSIRLSSAYRAIYIIHEDGTVHFIEAIEVNKHDY